MYEPVVGWWRIKTENLTFKGCWVFFVQRSFYFLIYFIYFLNKKKLKMSDKGGSALRGVDIDVSSQLIAIFYTLLILFPLCSNLSGFVTQPIITRLVRHVTQPPHIRLRSSSHLWHLSRGHRHTGTHGESRQREFKLPIDFTRSTKVALYGGVVAGWPQQWRLPRLRWFLTKQFSLSTNINRFSSGVSTTLHLDKPNNWLQSN